MNIELLKPFLTKNKAERIIYELNSKNKKEDAFTKLNDFELFFNLKNNIVDLTHLTDDEALKIISNTISEKYCLNLRSGNVEKIIDAYINSVNSYMCNILLINETTLIYIGEVEIGSSTKYIVRNK